MRRAENQPEIASRTLVGGCHCGRISVAFTTMLDVSSISPRACQCSFCLKQNAAWVSDRSGQVEVSTTGLSQDIYRFGLAITDFHVCSSCGVVVAATWVNEGMEKFAVVNVPALNRAIEFAAPTTANFDGEDAISRMSRRRENWTPATVRVTSIAASLSSGMGALCG